jgi:hypothetical protein
MIKSFPLENIRSENALLLLSLQKCSESERAEQIRALTRREIDWPYLIQTSLRHGLMPLLYRNLKSTCPEAIPEPILDQLQKYFLANVKRNLFLTGQLLKLLNLFEANGIPAIPVKGPALAASVYGDIGLRQFSDLDILIRKHDVQKATQMLLSQRYHSNFYLTKKQESVFLQSEYEYDFHNDDNRTLVEIQWGIVPRYLSFPFNTEGLWGRLKPAPLAGKEVLNFSPEDLLLILCVHSSKHRWERLLWVCDVANLIEVHQQMDWELILKTAEQFRIERTLLLGLFLVRDLIGIGLPEKVSRKVDTDPEVRKLAAKVYKRLFDDIGGSNEPLENHLFCINMRDRLWDKIRYCFFLGFTPSIGDWMYLSLPDVFFPLYYLIRPIRLTFKYGQRLFNCIYNGKK